MDLANPKTAGFEQGRHGVRLGRPDFDEGAAPRRQQRSQPRRQGAGAIQPVGAAGKGQAGLEPGDLGLQRGEFPVGDVGGIAAADIAPARYGPRGEGGGALYI